MTPRGRRLLAAGAGACLLVCLGTVTPAQADSTPDDIRSWGLTIDQRSDADLVTAIDDARERLRTSVQSIRTSLRTTVEGIRIEIASENAAQRIANKPAHDRELLMAVAQARSGLQTARAVYLSTVIAAVSAHAPGDIVPRALLETASWSGVGDGTWLDPLRIRTS